MGFTRFLAGFGIGLVLPAVGGVIAWGADWPIDISSAPTVHVHHPAGPRDLCDRLWNRDGTRDLQHDRHPVRDSELSLPLNELKGVAVDSR